MALALQLALESDTKLKVLLAARQQRAALMAPAINDGSTTVGGGSGVASQCLELLQERRLLEEEQAYLSCIQQLIAAKVKSDSSGDEKSVVARQEAQNFSW